MCCKCCQFFCAFFVPPLAVMCHSGCNRSFFINLILTLLGIVPGVVHAIFVICTEENERAIRVTTNVNVVTPQVMPMYQPVQTPPPPPFYSESPPPPPVYYPDPSLKN